nr:unnamed protein product [Digitaria exilis]
MAGLRQEEPRLVLPPGFRFHPTDAEVVVDYLTHKALDSSFSCVVIADVDLNKVEPWDLPGKAKMGEKEWFFFVHKDRKYPTGTRTNRATARGYWKATGKDKEIYRAKTLVGMKKTLVFYMGRAPRGDKTPWVMHEYRLDGKLPPNLPRNAKDEWAVCRVFNKDLAAKATAQMAPPHAGVEPPTAQMAPPHAGVEPPNSFLDDLPLDDILGDEPPPLMDYPPFSVDDLLDFKGESSSSGGGAAGMGSGGGYQVKSEHQEPRYFSLPAASNPGGDQAIRAHCNARDSAQASTPPLAGDMASRPPPYPELDELLQDDGYIDYSNMLKF